MKTSELMDILENSYQENKEVFDKLFKQDNTETKKKTKSKSTKK